uniref:Uncharacterized protein n=1 Tax=Chlorobium chlorochromatii (strain CaD3) TaxID=340177 RepID=Q3APC9_CHLCH
MKYPSLFPFILSAATMVASTQSIQATETKRHADAKELPQVTIPDLPFATAPDAPQALGLRQSSITGSAEHDYIKLYGNGGQARHPEPVRNPSLTRSNTFSSTVAIELNGTILAGTEAATPTVRFFINGKDVGVATLSTEQSAYSKKTGGVPHSDLQRFTFHVDELAIREIKLVVESAPVPQSEVYIHRVNINAEVNLDQNLEANALRGAAVNFATPSALWEGRNGYQLPQGAIPSDVRSVTIDTALYQTTLQRAPGTPSNPIIVQGGGGEDTLYLLGSSVQYLLAVDEGGTLVIAESQGLDQNALATNIARLEFADGSFFLAPQTVAGKAITLATGSEGSKQLRAQLPAGMGITVRPLSSSAMQEQLRSLVGKSVQPTIEQRLSALFVNQLEPQLVLRGLDFATLPMLRHAADVELNGSTKGKQWVMVESNALPDGAHVTVKDVDGLLLSGSRDLLVQSKGKSVTIVAGDGNQELRSEGGNDLLFGGNGNDRLFAGAGNDELCGGNGDNLLDGGAGSDVAFFSGNVAEYRMTHNAATNMTSVVDSIPNRDGSNQLINIEQLRFADRTELIAQGK